MQTKDQQNARLREYRKRTGNLATKKYEKTKKGFLMRCYRNMESRVSGVQKLKSHLYKDKPILPRDDFNKWAIDNKDFHLLFDAWELAKYDRKLSPSINRINPELGYVLGNMEWITHSENSKRTRRWS